MVRPSGRREGDDLGPVMDRTGRVEGRTFTTSSRDARGRHGTSDHPANPTHFAHGFHHGTGEPRSSAQPPPIPFRSRPPLQPHQSHNPMPYEPYGSAQPSSHPIDTLRQIGAELFDQMFGAAPQDSSCSTHGYSHAEYGKGLTGSFMSVMSKFIGSRNKRPEVAYEVPALTQKRKKVKPSNWEQTEPAEGGPVNPKLIPSYGGHVAGRM
ncbi:hypothetical protein M9H77_13899 [Catharanthus roseus]|uniref:Uncharacterized protein n=1 Tax=Catharanthus roseus TaxID=4058 RepID=A0ACC0BLG8_CATRO|nr:hypothetical protein M9H77_13899 [Catharanthus roseus]